MKIKQLKNDYFILVTSGYSILISFLYFWQGVVETFSPNLLLYIAINLLFIPITLIAKKNICVPYLLIYSVILNYLLAFTPTYLYNNFSSFFLICIVLSICPRVKKLALLIYFITSTLAFMYNSEKLYHYFIHITRCGYFYLLISFITSKLEKIKLDLTKDETLILRQLSLGLQQKEIKEFSKNTVTKKLRAARERNKITSNYELIVKYKNSYK